MKKQSTIRKHRVEVRLSDEELEQLKNMNPPSLARLLRESALGMKQDKKQYYSKIDQTFILELSRIGNNINQIAKAVHLDVAQTNSFDKVKLLHLLISIDQQLKELRCNNDH